ncbi:MAG: hypothetical protein Q4G42_02585 [Neisseria sp.]|nr:hypothetical protein [Neisseria sp.]
MKLTRILCLLLLWAALPAQAAVYECQRGGETIYTNKSGSGCRAMKLSSIGSYTSDQRAYANSGSVSNTAPVRSSNVVRSSRSGTATERVSPQVQLQRDGGRLSILQRELENEQKALATAQRNLALGKANKGNAAHIASLEGAVKDRQENINALQKEISRM